MEEYIAKHPFGCMLCVGISLSSRAVTSQVFSAPLSLTSVFGMGTGGPSASSTPTILLYLKAFQLFYLLVTRAGIEPALPAWEAGVLTAWPTGHIDKKNRLMGLFFLNLVHLQGLEPRTHWLRVSCSTNWAKGAYMSASIYLPGQSPAKYFRRKWA